MSIVIYIFSVVLKAFCRLMRLGFRRQDPHEKHDVKDQERSHELHDQRVVKPAPTEVSPAKHVGTGAPTEHVGTDVPLPESWPEDLLCDQPHNLDPLVARTQANLTLSPLLMLPNEILIQIMKSLRLYDLLRLRNVSRQFLYLFSLPDFQWAHEEPWVGDIWQPADRRRRERASFRMETLKQMYCIKCLAMRKKRARGRTAPELEYVHCSGCGSDHHARLFSAAQLRAHPSERVCIGREGKINLCQHVSIDYEKLQSLLRQWQGKLNKEIVVCDHPCHNMSGDQSSHIRGHEQPVVMLVKDEWAPEEILCIRLIATSHVMLGNGNAKPSAQGFRDWLHALQDQSPTSWYPLHHPQVTPLRTIDPNVCDCVVYPGADTLFYPLKEPSSYHPAKDQEALWSRPGAPTQAITRCSAVSHDFTESFHDSQTHLSTMMYNCLRHKDGRTCVELVLHRLLAVGEPWKPQWRFALDWRSYGTLAFKNVIWCDNEQCWNHQDRRLEEITFSHLKGFEEQVARPNQPCGENCDLKSAMASGSKV